MRHWDQQQDGAGWSVDRRMTSTKCQQHLRSTCGSVVETCGHVGYVPEEAVLALFSLISCGL